MPVFNLFSSQNVEISTFLLIEILKSPSWKILMFMLQISFQCFHWKQNIFTLLNVNSKIPKYSVYFILVCWWTALSNSFQYSTSHSYCNKPLIYYLKFTDQGSMLYLKIKQWLTGTFPFWATTISVNLNWHSSKTTVWLLHILRAVSWKVV